MRIFLLIGALAMTAGCSTAQTKMTAKNEGTNRKIATADEYQRADGKAYVTYSSAQLVQPAMIEITGEAAKLIYDQISWTDQMNSSTKTRENLG